MALIFCRVIAQNVVDCVLICWVISAVRVLSTHPADYRNLGTENRLGQQVVRLDYVRIFETAIFPKLQ